MAQRCQLPKRLVTVRRQCVIHKIRQTLVGVLVYLGIRSQLQAYSGTCSTADCNEAIAFTSRRRQFQFELVPVGRNLNRLLHPAFTCGAVLAGLIAYLSTSCGLLTTNFSRSFMVLGCNQHFFTALTVTDLGCRTGRLGSAVVMLQCFLNNITTNGTLAIFCTGSHFQIVLMSPRHPVLRLSLGAAFALVHSVAINARVIRLADRINLLDKHGIAVAQLLAFDHTAAFTLTVLGLSTSGISPIMAQRCQLPKRLVTVRRQCVIHKIRQTLVGVLVYLGIRSQLQAYSGTCSTADCNEAIAFTSRRRQFQFELVPVGRNLNRLLHPAFTCGAVLAGLIAYLSTSCGLLTTNFSRSFMVLGCNQHFFTALTVTDLGCRTGRLGSAVIMAQLGQHYRFAVFRFIHTALALIDLIAILSTSRCLGINAVFFHIATILEVIMSIRINDRLLFLMGTTLALTVFRSTRLSTGGFGTTFMFHLVAQQRENYRLLILTGIALVDLVTIHGTSSGLGINAEIFHIGTVFALVVVAQLSLRNILTEVTHLVFGTSGSLKFEFMLPRNNILVLGFIAVFALINRVTIRTGVVNLTHRSNSLTLFSEAMAQRLQIFNHLCSDREFRRDILRLIGRGTQFVSSLTAALASVNLVTLVLTIASFGFSHSIHMLQHLNFFMAFEIGLTIGAPQALLVATLFTGRGNALIPISIGMVDRRRVRIRNLELVLLTPVARVHVEASSLTSSSSIAALVVGVRFTFSLQLLAFINPGLTILTELAITQVTDAALSLFLILSDILMTGCLQRINHALLQNQILGQILGLHAILNSEGVILDIRITHTTGVGNRTRHDTTGCQLTSLGVSMTSSRDDLLIRFAATIITGTDLLTIRNTVCFGFGRPNGKGMISSSQCSQVLIRIPQRSCHSSHFQFVGRHRVIDAIHLGVVILITSNCHITGIGTGRCSQLRNVAMAHSRNDSSFNVALVIGTNTLLGAFSGTGSRSYHGPIAIGVTGRCNEDLMADITGCRIITSCLCTSAFISLDMERIVSTDSGMMLTIFGLFPLAIVMPGRLQRILQIAPALVGQRLENILVSNLSILVDLNCRILVTIGTINSDLAFDFTLRHNAHGSHKSMALLGFQHHAAAFTITNLILGTSCCITRHMFQSGSSFLPSVQDFTTADATVSIDSVNLTLCRSNRYLNR